MSPDDIMAAIKQMDLDVTELPEFWQVTGSYEEYSFESVTYEINERGVGVYTLAYGFEVDRVTREDALDLSQVILDDYRSLEDLADVARNASANLVEQSDTYGSRCSEVAQSIAEKFDVRVETEIGACFDADDCLVFFEKRVDELIDELESGERISEDPALLLTNPLVTDEQRERLREILNPQDA